MADSRFAEFTAEEINKILIDKNSVKTKNGTVYAIKIFHVYCMERHHFETTVDVDNCSNEQLDKLLKYFYVEIRNVHGEKYSVNSLRAIRAGVNRYYNEPPYSKGNITTSSDFLESNRMFEASTVDLKRSGHGDVVHKPVISKYDCERLDDYFSHYAESPTILLHKVWYNIMGHFCRRGQEGLRDLTTASYAITNDPSGVRYVYKVGSEITKNHRMDTESATGGVMAECVNSPVCPVRSYELYLSKVNKDVNALFQRPKSKPNGEQWYDKAPLGKNSLGSLMSKISKASGLSQIYTNHSIRASTITSLSDAGYDSRQIQSVSKHLNINSIENYARDSSIAQKLQMSSTISATSSAVKSTATTSSFVEPTAPNTSSVVEPAVPTVVEPAPPSVVDMIVPTSSDLVPPVTPSSTGVTVARKRSLSLNRNTTAKRVQVNDDEDYGNFDSAFEDFFTGSSISLSNIHGSTINIYVKK